ncbi:MAG: T9SS type A sorting domain-containing protein [Bacteroidia bacterium]|jgi:predicted GH43/DUF377 family glycosyl hydrolase|nr:T9SS type A sorting domain-containing protein [Bacteroidia bacterium]
MKHILITIAIVFPPLYEGMGPLFAQTIWTKDASNPVLRRDTVYANLPNDIFAISDGWVVKEGATYKMWYTCGGINYPTDTLLRARQCYATSVDGINWIKYSGNPVLDVSYTGGWDSLGIETPSVIIDSTAPPAERYKMWYAGAYFNSYRYDIGYAYSSDGINWTKYPNPVLQVGMPAEWDNGFLEGPSVIKEGGIYKMWYCGYDAIGDGNGTDGKANIGYATSPDGITWTKSSSNPIITTGINTWDSIYVQDPHVMKQGNLYYMWYGGGADPSFGQQVGFATSSDGINWTKSNANPVLTSGIAGEWDANTASFPSVLNDGGMYKMWYTGKDVDPLPVNSLNYYWEIGYATAPITGINEIRNDDNSFITVFPNPFSSSATIEADKNLHNATLTVYNLLGQKVIQINNINGQTYSLSRGNLESGHYFVWLLDGDGTLAVTKLVITD